MRPHVGTVLETIAHHWKVYLIEGALLGIFMFAACVTVAAIEHPESPLRKRLRSPLHRRAIIGAAMGTTAVILIYSPWGACSGAHFNPAVTLAFALLGRIPPTDAVFYVLSQCIGGLLGVSIARVSLGRRVAHPSVGYVVTKPGRFGARAAFLAELAIAFLLFTVVLAMARSPIAPYTGIAAGGLVALYITIEAPISGMSMNPARTLASALHARSFASLWIYLVAPPLAMVCAAGMHVLILGAPGEMSATMNQQAAGRCMLNCLHHLGGGHPIGSSGIQQGATRSTSNAAESEATP